MAKSWCQRKSPVLLSFFVSFLAPLTTTVCPFMHYLRFSYKDFDEFENGMFVKLPFSMVTICSCAVRNAWCHSRPQDSSLLYMTTDKRNSGKPCSKVFFWSVLQKHFKCLLLVHSCLCESGYTCHLTLVIQLTSTLPFLEEGEGTCKKAL